MELKARWVPSVSAHHAFATSLSDEDRLDLSAASCDRFGSTLGASKPGLAPEHDVLNQAMSAATELETLLPG
jgi:hypothetical protein